MRRLWRFAWPALLLVGGLFLLSVAFLSTSPSAGTNGGVSASGGGPMELMLAFVGGASAVVGFVKLVFETLTAIRTFFRGQGSTAAVPHRKVRPKPHG
jgi:hypothetical protein